MAVSFDDIASSVNLVDVVGAPSVGVELGMNEDATNSERPFAVSNEDVVADGVGEELVRVEVAYHSSDDGNRRSRRSDWSGRGRWRRWWRRSQGRRARTLRSADEVDVLDVNRADSQLGRL